MVHGQCPEDVKKDEEGMQIMRVLGRNMAWMLKSIHFKLLRGISPMISIPNRNTYNN